MSELEQREKGYLSKLFSSIRNLLSAKEKISLNNIRLDYLQYFFAFPLAMVFVNIQDFFIDDGISIFGLSYTTLTFIAFAFGAIIMFAFANETNISVISKLSAIITVIGFIPWLFLPNNYISLVFSVVFMIGIGGCVSNSSFSYVFMLNNAERFYASVLMILLISLLELSAGIFSSYYILQKVFAFIIIVAICICMYLSKAKDYQEIPTKEKNKLDPSVWLVLFIFFSYFAIRISGFYAPAFQHPADSLLWGILAFSLISFFIVLQLVFNLSIWTMCNVFFISSILSYLMSYINLPKVAYLFSEIKELGLLISLYLIACVTNKFCDFRTHKRFMLLCMTSIAILYAGIDFLHTIMPTQSIAVVTAAVLFLIFLLLSPAFSKYLFFTCWSKEFSQINMSSYVKDVLQDNSAKQGLEASLDSTNLTIREKQVVLLLLQGMTIKEVAPELGLTVSTVSTYTKTIYKKLGVNSRAELILMFLHS